LVASNAVVQEPAGSCVITLHVPSVSVPELRPISSETVLGPVIVTRTVSAGRLGAELA
jgi:hypothetical protein